MDMVDKELLLLLRRARLINSIRTREILTIGCHTHSLFCFLYIRSIENKKGPTKNEITPQKVRMCQAKKKGGWLRHFDK
jgi:hypothetical protein